MNMRGEGMSDRAGVKGQAGFSVVEVLVALTFTLITVTAFAAGTAAVARLSATSSGLVQRSASLSEYVAELYATPFNDLPATGCEDVAGDYPYERCVSVTDISARRKQITVTVTPDDPRMPADTMTIERGVAVGTNPFSS